MWKTFLIGFAYLDVGVTILVTYFMPPLILVWVGIVYLSKRGLFRRGNAKTK